MKCVELHVSKQLYQNFMYEKRRFLWYQVSRELLCFFVHIIYI